MKIGSGIQKLIRGDSHVHRQHGDVISLLLFFQNKEERLKIANTSFENVANHIVGNERKKSKFD
jgi:hypothetical protein